MDDGRIHIYGTMAAQNNTDLSVKGSYASTTVVYTTPTSDSYTLSAATEGNVRNSELHFYSKNTGPYDDGINLASGTDSKTLHAQNYTWLMVRVPATTSAVDFYVTPMVSLTSFDDISFQSYARTNSNLTILEAEDRASLIEVVDSGAKNLCTNSSITSQIVGNFSDVSWFSQSIPAGTYVLRATVTSAQPSQMVLVNANNTAIATVKPTVSSGTNVDYISESFTIAEAVKGFKIYSNANPTTWTDIMICTKAAFSVSPKFVPYAKSNYSLTQSAVQVSSTLGSSVDFNNITKTGVYKFTPTPTNAPLGCYGILSVYASENYISQIVQSMHHATTAGLFYRYSFDSGATWWHWIGRFVNSYWQTSITTANAWQSVGSVTIDPHTAVKLEAGIEKYSSTSAYPRGILLSSSTSVSGIAVSNTLCKSEVSADTQTSIYVSATHLNADNTSQVYYVYVKLANADYANIQVIQENLGRK